MTDDKLCISNHMGAVPSGSRPFPCRRRGIDSDGARIPSGHYATCDDDACRGCVPRPAEYGYLCGVCYRRLQASLTRFAWLTAHLRSIEKPPQALGERVDTSMEKSILFPDTWIAADELMESLGGNVIPSTASIDEAIRLAHDLAADWMADTEERINTVEGARRAVVMLKRFTTALKRWPDSEAQYRHIPYVTCPNCHSAHLWRRAPERVGDELLVQCSTPDCGYVTDWDEWTKTYAPVFAAIEAEAKRAEKAERKAG